MSIRTWLVTGCSSGFGRALAQDLLERGEQVVATARTPDRLVEWIAPHGARALLMKLDITRQEEITATVTAARKRFGNVDVLVNNAAYGAVGTVEETSIDVARALMETNYFGTLAMIRAVLPDMLARRTGHIINIGSVAGQIGFPLLGYYSASKFALAGVSESIAAELRPLGIRVTLAELGPFATDFTRNMAVNRPAPHYDMAALGQVAGNAGWGAGEDPHAGVAALLAAVNDPDPPVRMVLGQPAIDVIALHNARRAQAQLKWLPVSRLVDSGK